MLKPIPSLSFPETMSYSVAQAVQAGLELSLTLLQPP